MLHKKQGKTLAGLPLAKRRDLCYLIDTEIEILHIDRAARLKWDLRQARSDTV